MVRRNKKNRDRQKSRRQEWLEHQYEQRQIEAKAPNQNQKSNFFSSSASVVRVQHIDIDLLCQDTLNIPTTHWQMSEQ